MHGCVLSLLDQKPIPDVTIDVWQANTNGLFEQKDKERKGCDLRARRGTDAAGGYALICSRPTPYPIPDDGE